MTLLKPEYQTMNSWMAKQLVFVHIFSYQEKVDAPSSLFDSVDQMLSVQGHWNSAQYENVIVSYTIACVGLCVSWSSLPLKGELQHFYTTAFVIKQTYILAWIQRELCRI